MKAKTWAIPRYIETVFACVVIGACVFTVVSTMLSSSRRQLVQKATNQNALKQERQSFLASWLSRKIYDKSKNMNEESPVVELYPDHAKEWFARKPVLRYVSKIPHPNLTEPIIANTFICNSSEVDILIYFHSLWSHFEHRRVLRESWANKNVFSDIRVRTIFILGKPSKKEDQLKINNENLHTKDIVQGNFDDTQEKSKSEEHSSNAVDQR